MGKIFLDKYYTKPELAQCIIEKTNEVIGKENITEFLEPSAGNGVFLKFFDKPYLAYDIEPEGDNIIKQDYLELDIEYKKGRCIIGNPPFGKGNYKSVNFYKKAIYQGDYISFILPISQLNNNLYMYEFDLIYSEDLGKNIYTDRSIHCCLNIYKRNKKGFNKKPKFELEDIKLKGVSTGKSRNDKVPENYDFSICGFGSSCGKICEYEGQYCQQIYFNIKSEFKEKVRYLIEKADWKNMYSMVSTPKIKHWMIVDYLKNNIPNIK